MKAKQKKKKKTHWTDGRSGRGLDMARCAACRGRGQERVVVVGASVVVGMWRRGWEQQRRGVTGIDPITIRQSLNTKLVTAAL